MTRRWHAVVRVVTDVPLAPEVGRPTLYDLALDPAVHADSQAAAREQVVHRTGQGLLGLGDEVRFRAHHLGIWWSLTSAITDADRPARFVDEQVRGPFTAFAHEHRFEAADTTTRMVDVFSFSLPGGPAGRLVACTIAAPYLRHLLTQRGGFLRDTALAASGGDPD